MKFFKMFLSLSWFLFAVAIGQGSALGQVFVFEATHVFTEYCGNGDFTKSAGKIFVKVDLTNDQVIVSENATFDDGDDITYDLTSYTTVGTKTAFLAETGDVDAYSIAQGTTTSDSKGQLRSFLYTFIEKSEDDCFAFGTGKSGKRRKDLE